MSDPAEHPWSLGDFNLWLWGVKEKLLSWANPSESNLVFRPDEQTMEDDGYEEGEYSDTVYSWDWEMDECRSLDSTDSEAREYEFDELEVYESYNQETQGTERSEQINASREQVGGDGPEATNTAADHLKYFPGYIAPEEELEATQIENGASDKLLLPMAASFIKRNYVRYGNVQIRRGIVIDWAFVNFSSMHDRVHCFLDKLTTVSRAIRMHMSDVPVKFFHVESGIPNNIGITFWDVRKGIMETLSRIDIKGEPIGLLLVILSDKRDFDAKIIEACKNLRVVYHCCLPCDVYKPTKQHLKGTAREIKSKVVERDTFIPFVSEGPTIILGADTSFNAVASVVTPVDWQEFGDYRAVVEPNKEAVIQQLGDMICNFLGSVWKIKRDCRIIFFRHGINEDHITHIFHQEPISIKLAFTHKIGFEPSVTFVVVGGKGIEQDSTPDFLCQHGSVEGTRIARYRVIHDDHNLRVDVLESIIIKLCLLRDQEVYPKISMVPAAYAAWLAASRAQECISDDGKTATSSSSGSNGLC